jgi:hypothetical protein
VATSARISLSQRTFGAFDHGLLKTVKELNIRHMHPKDMEHQGNLPTAALGIRRPLTVRQ